MDIVDVKNQLTRLAKKNKLQTERLHRKRTEAATPPDPVPMIPLLVKIWETRDEIEAIARAREGLQHAGHVAYARRMLAGTVRRSHSRQWEHCIDLVLARVKFLREGVEAGLGVLGDVAALKSDAEFVLGACGEPEAGLLKGLGQKVGAFPDHRRSVQDAAAVTPLDADRLRKAREEQGRHLGDVEQVVASLNRLRHMKEMAEAAVTFAQDRGAR